MKRNKTARLTLRLSPAARRWLDYAAAVQGCTAGEVVRRMIEEQRLAPPTTDAEAFEQAKQADAG